MATQHFESRWVKTLGAFQSSTWSLSAWDLLRLGLFVLIVGYCMSLYRNYGRLASHPGPWMNRLSYWPMLYARWKGAIGARNKYAALSSQYGKLVRIGPNDLLTSDPELIARMSAPSSTYERSSWYAATRLNPYHDMMGSVMDKSVHASLKSKTAAGYRAADIPGFEAGLDEGIEALFALIRQKYISGNLDGELALSETASDPNANAVDLGRLVELYAMDARSRMSFNQPLGLLQRDEDILGLIKTARLAVNFLQFITDIPPLQAFLTSDLVLRLLGPKPSDTKGFGKIMGIARDHVATRLSSSSVHDEQDLLASFLRRGLDARSAEAEVMFPMVAGADTAAKAINSVLSLVLSHQQAYDKLVEEVKYWTPHISRPATYKETLQMPYLRAVVYESLRMQPPFLGLLMKQTGRNGDTYQGKYIPPSTRIAHDTWSLTHDHAVFGHDAEVFRPERWLQADSKQKAIMQKQAELVFGTGRWQCAGKNVALMELHKIVVEIIRNFELRLVSDGPQVTISQRSKERSQ